MGSVVDCGVSIVPQTEGSRSVRDRAGVPRHVVDTHDPFACVVVAQPAAFSRLGLGPDDGHEDP